MPVVYREGNLLDVVRNDDSVAIFHGCNAQGRRASGFAGSLMNYLKVNFNYPSKEYPDKYAEYCNKQHDRGIILGKIVIEVMPTKLTIINGICQLNYGRDTNQIYVSYKHLYKALRKACKHCKDFNLDLVMPLVGAGLGGGDPRLVDFYIRLAASHTPEVSVFVYVLPKPSSTVNVVNF